jgi:membrane protein DedA with SNARE-associated domain
MHHLIESLGNWYKASLEQWGYWLVALLMAVESSIFPLPSEIVIPPAAHFARMSGKMSVLGVIIAGTIGSWIGAAVMYWISRVAGRPFVLKYGKYFFISEEKVHGAERWAKTFGPLGIFASRLLPVVRHLIGIPAGIVEIDFRIYSLYTIIGSAIWCSVLAWLGVKVGDDIVKGGQAKHLTMVLVGFVVVVGLLYYFAVHKQMKAAKPEVATTPPPPAE